MSKINILIATESFYPDGYGGTHTYTYNLAKGLIKRGHTVWLLTLKMHKDAPSEEDIDGIKVIRYNSATKGRLLFIRRPILSIVNSYRKFKEISKKINFDIISLHAILPGFGIALSTQSKFIPKVFTFHSSVYQEAVVQSKKKRYASFFDPIIFYVVKLVEKFCIKICKKIVVLSEFNKNQLLKIYGIDFSKINVIPGGVDTAKFKPATDISKVREKLDLPNDKIIILTVRRLVARMGLENLISAMGKIVEKHKNVLLIIGGDGFLRGKLERLIDQEILRAHVKLLGFIDENQLTYYYQAADFFVLPTQNLEGFGLVTLEALATGLPVLGTPIGGTLEILRNLDKDLLFKGIGPEEISEGILNFIGRKDEWKEIREKCRMYVSNNYSWDDIVLKNENLFLDTL